jgi:hypothetical protein
MAGITVSVQVASNRLGALAAAYPQRAGRIVRETGFEIEAGCKQRSRVDTGDMRNRWRFEQTGPAEGEVVNDSDHVLPNEYGTRFMSAQPMAHPAADAARPGFEAKLAKALGDV